MPENTSHASPVASPPDAGRRRNPVPDRTGYAVAAVGGVLLAITGAFGTGEAPLAVRLAYWLVVMLSGALIGTAVTAAVHGWGGLARTAVLEGAAIAVGIALPLTLLVCGASMAAFGLRGYSLVAIAYMFVLVLFVSCVMVAINYLLAAQRRAGMAEARLAPAAPLPVAAAVESFGRPRGASRFGERLPLALRGARLIAVASEDHYLRVYTDAGETLILLRLADAVAELADVPGAQTHRSWWVAQDAVTRVERSAGKATLYLTGGVVAPVSRSFLPLIAARGWR